MGSLNINVDGIKRFILETLPRFPCLRYVELVCPTVLTDKSGVVE